VEGESESEKVHWAVRQAIMDYIISVTVTSRDQVQDKKVNLVHIMNASPETKLLLLIVKKI
jgi:hypothetical protein